MKLLVTGGAGFIGSNFVRRVADGTLTGYSHITVLDKLTYAGSLTNLSEIDSHSFDFIRGDICDSTLVMNLLKNHDAIINFAAESHVDKSISDASEFIRTNIQGTHILLQSAVHCETKVFVQVSTDEVYGSIISGSWSEEFPLAPNSPYAASKASAELISQAYANTFGLDLRITRCSNNYGRNQFPEKIIPLFITNIIDGKKVPIYGTGLNVRDWLNVDDHCLGIHKVLMSQEKGSVFNIGGGQELSNLELTYKILDYMGVSENFIEFVPDRQGHDFRYSVDISKIKTNLGYSPIVTFEKGLSETIDWYVNNEKWWRPLIKK